MWRRYVKEVVVSQNCLPERSLRTAWSGTIQNPSKCRVEDTGPAEKLTVKNVVLFTSGLRETT
jgi:hypothetical protein